MSDRPAAAEKDEFERKLDEALTQLHSCQEEKGYKSCMTCAQIVGCQLRNHYVKAVYMSMNKGKGGGFEF